jgi:hypothetical protein
MIPHPISPSHLLLHAKPAESETKFFVHSGGSSLGCGIGSQGSESDKKFDHTHRSFFENFDSSILRGDFSAAFRSSSFKLCLNPLRNRAIWLTWLSLPINLCISFKLKLSLSLAFFISAKVFCFFESGRDHVNLDVSKFIPRTLPRVWHVKALSLFLQFGCQLHVNFPTQFGIFFRELLTPFCFRGGYQRYIIQLPVDQLSWYFAFL